MARLSWKKLREATAVADAPALLRGQDDDEPDETENGGPDADADDQGSCPTCGGNGIKGGEICPTCMGSGRTIKESAPLASDYLCAVCFTADCSVAGVSRIREAVLTAKARKAIPKGKFAIPSKAPGSGSYPIPDRTHAINALARASGKPEEAQVKAAVHREYPDLGQTKEVETGTLLERLESLELLAAHDRQMLRSLRESQPALMTPTFSTPTRVKTSDGKEGYRVTLIREGRGNSEDDQWYTGDAVREMVESGVCEGMQAFGNHPTEQEEEQRPERDVKQVVGTYHDVKFAESGGKARADAIFVPLTYDEHHPQYGWVVTLAEAAVRSTAQTPFCGISLFGLSAGDDVDRPDGTFGRMVSIIRPQSGDIVTNAGAGGGFVRQLMESARALRKRSGKELPPMKSMAYQSAVREAVKRVREATSDEERTEALEALTTLEAETIDNVPDSIEQLREAAPALVTEIETAVKAEEGKTVEKLTEQLREAQQQLGGITDALGLTEALREAGVEDPIELRFYAQEARKLGLREASDVKQMVETKRGKEEREQEALLAKMREAFDVGDSEVEGVMPRVPIASLPSDGGVEALRESGIPTLDAE